MAKMPNRIREIREMRKMSQRDLAKLVGCTDGSISRLEAGERRLTSDWMSKIADALRVRPAELFAENPSDEVGTQRMIKVLGEASERTWSEGEESPQVAFVPVLPFGRYRNYNHFAYQVLDDHARIVAPRGSFVIVVPPAAMRAAPQDGGFVVITERKGEFYRHVVRSVVLRGGVACAVVGDEPVEISSLEVDGFVVGVWREFA
jgi:transcriptional regulator with XRE-family HTH domain